MEPKTWEYELGPKELEAQDREAIREYLFGPAIPSVLGYVALPAVFCMLAALWVKRSALGFEKELGLAFASGGFAAVCGLVMSVYFSLKGVRNRSKQFAGDPHVLLKISDESISWSWAGERISADWKDVRLIRIRADRVHVKVGPVERVFYRSDTNDEATKLIEERAQK